MGRQNKKAKKAKKAEEIGSPDTRNPLHHSLPISPPVEGRASAVSKKLDRRAPGV
jgi:hypothetical protein